MRTPLKQALRSFFHTPWFTCVALLTLALGIGLNSALFSVVKAVLVENLPYGKSEQLIRVWVTNPTQGFDRDVTSWPRFEDWKARSRMIADFAGFTGARLILTGSDEPVQLRGAFVTSNLLRVMGVQPMLGHDFNITDDQEGQPRVVMISHGLWLRSFAADNAIVGKRLKLSGNDYTISGVLPESFAFPERDLDFWAPLVLNRDRRQARGTFFMNVVARLKDGIGLEQAQNEMNSIAHALQSEYIGDRNLGVALVGLKEDLTGSMRPALMVLSAAVTFILLICCANIASMLSSRGAERERELSIRMALGASRAQVLKQLVIESVMLFVCGGILGAFVAYGGIRLLLRFAPAELPQLQDTHLDLTMIAFTFIVSAVCGFIFGLKPAFHASRASTVDSLKSGGRGIAGRMASRRFRTVLTLGEIALAMVLTTGAVLMVRSFARMQQANPGFDSQHVFVAPVQLPASKYSDSRQASQFYDSLLMKLRGTAGIQSAGVISTFLLGRLPDSDVFTIEGRTQTIFTPLTIDVVSPDLFVAMKVPLMRGRMFDSRDRADSTPVVMINETTAKRYWPNADAIGQRFTYGSGGPNATWFTIVGVVADTRRAGIDQAVFNESYLPMSQQPERMMQVIVRSALPTSETRQALTAAVRELDAEQPLAGFQTIDQAMGQRTASRRFVVFLLSLFAATAAGIGGVGIYGLISYLVVQRRQEFGVRVALGASPSDVAALVLRDVALLGTGGLIIGGVSASVFSRLLDTLLFGVGRLDPASYAAAALAIAGICLIATTAPLLRALRVDPMIALRE